MSMTVTVSNEANLRKIKQFLGAKDESEAVEIIVERAVKEFEQNQIVKDLPDSFFADLFAEKTTSSDGETIKAVLNEREESKL